MPASEKHADLAISAGAGVLGAGLGALLLLWIGLNALRN
jgi:hypothetical protein